jgi:hypothetical protein
LFLILLHKLQDKQDKKIFEGNFFMSFHESKDRNESNKSQWDNIPSTLQNMGADDDKPISVENTAEELEPQGESNITAMAPSKINKGSLEDHEKSNQHTTMATNTIQKNDEGTTRNKRKVRSNVQVPRNAEKKKTGKRAKQTDIHQESPVPNEYELQRLERIMRNKERLVALGLDMSKENTHLPKQDKNKIKVSAEC